MFCLVSDLVDVCVYGVFKLMFIYIYLNVISENDDFVYFYRLNCLEFIS
jgi:hypothetical protein